MNKIIFYVTRADPFSEGFRFVGKPTRSHQSCLPVEKKAKKYTKCIHFHYQSIA